MTAEKKHTICRLCSACCPVEVEVAGGHLLKAERSHRKSAFFRPCPKLAAAAEIIYARERLKQPRRRRPGKSTIFEEISWDQAYDLAAEKLNQIKKEHGPEQVAWLRGMAADWGVPWDYANRLMHAFGSPNAIGNGSVCHVAREMANYYTCGAMPAADPLNSDCIVIWGKNDLDTAPNVGEKILAARDAGAWLIVVDPVRTELAAQADIHLQIRPGHDLLLAMAMINEIIRQQWYDRDFIESHGLGFNELTTVAAGYPAAMVAADCWLTAVEIKDAARLYATSASACLIEGNGLDMQLETFQATRAVSMLRALTGNLDRPGGDLIPQPLPLKNIQLQEKLPPNLQAVTAGHQLFADFHPTWGRHAQSALIDAILEEKPYTIRALIVQSGNPALSMTDSGRVRRALEKLEFLMVIDLFPTRTTALADLILPAASCFAETQLNRAFVRNQPVILQQQVIEPVGNSRPDWQIIFELARALGLEEDFPWQGVEEALDDQLRPSGLTVAELKKNPHGLRAENLRYEKFRESGFATPSGKIEFHSPRLAAAGFAPVPLAAGFDAEPLSYRSWAGADALTAISGARDCRFTHSQFRQVEKLRHPNQEPLIEIHPDEAAARKLAAGQKVKLATPKGEVVMPLRLSDRARPGTVIIAWGWGEVDDLYNLNQLTDDQRRDPITATPANRGFMCRLTPAEES